ncbi:hypothetical protein ES703_104577 [subsurface metagenome]
MRVDKKERLFYILLAVFVVWLIGVFGGFGWIVATDVSKLDPMLTLVAGLSVGVVTEFFILALTLSWQFWFRKKGPSETQE